jgi:hypothetical protein
MQRMSVPYWSLSHKTVVVIFQQQESCVLQIMLDCIDSPQMLGIVGAQILEGHSRDYGGVSQGLKLHVTAVLGPLELDDDEPGVLVDAQTSVCTRR